MTPDRPFKGALLLVLGEGLLAVMAAMIKHLSDTLPVEMIVFGRNLIGLAVLLPVLVASGGIRDLRTSHLRLHFIRGFTGVTAMFCFFFTIAHIPLAEAVLVKMTVPFFLPLVAWLWLKDRISGYTWAAIVLGFVGVGVILRADEGVVDPVMLVALAGAAIMSIAKVSIRRMAASEPRTGWCSIFPCSPLCCRRCCCCGCSKCPPVPRCSGCWRSAAWQSPGSSP